MCVCCPALRSRSRQPVKRYKKLLADIFPKSSEAHSNDRKFLKLCEYASKNPCRIPKIAKCLEERFYKELRSGNIKLVSIIVEAYNKLLCICKEQMAYFAVNLLNIVFELLDDSKQDAMLIMGCDMLTNFIYCQVDGTYTFNIENFGDKVCLLSRKTGDQQHGLRASSLRCLSSMVWFMAEFSHIFADFEKEFSANSLVEDDATSISSVADISRFIPKLPPSASPNNSHIVSIGQLLESALEVAGQVAGTTVSTSPLPYNAMTNQCEALGSDTRKKLSKWLTHDDTHFSIPSFSPIEKITSHQPDGGTNSWLVLNLPPASPFDNFLRAARG